MLSTADEFALLVADVYELAGALRRSGESLAATENQTQARWQLMSAVSEDSMSVPTAAARLGISRQAVQRVANDLVTDNLAVFMINPGHRTSPLLTLTETGRTTLSAIDRLARSTNRRNADRVGADTVTALRAGIGRILTALE